LIDRLIERAEIGIRLIKGWRVVLAGRTNVGKSSLLNALAGYRRSIVDEAHGTTRDLVTLGISIDGWPVEISDTAGLRTTSENLEQQGIERARAAYARADLLIPVLDLSRPLGVEDHMLINLHSDRSGTIIANKSDLPPAWEPSELRNVESRIVKISAKEGLGIARLLEAIGHALVPEPPRIGAGIPIQKSDVRILRDVRESLAVRDREGALARLKRLVSI
jgi:tRNA modification GTPase